jgi:hypothetical protein
MGQWRLLPFPGIAILVTVLIFNLSFLSMISGQTLRVCPERKRYPPDHARVRLPNHASATAFQSKNDGVGIAEARDAFRATKMSSNMSDIAKATLSGGFARQAFWSCDKMNFNLSTAC